SNIAYLMAGILERRIVFEVVADLGVLRKQETGSCGERHEPFRIRGLNVRRTGPYRLLVTYQLVDESRVKVIILGRKLQRLRIRSNGLGFLSRINGSRGIRQRLRTQGRGNNEQEKHACHKAVRDSI